jgi:hypothetical protein
MSTWKKVALVNGGWVIGIVISLFVVPPSTPLWLWATVSGLVLAVLNYLFFGQQRRATSGRKIGPMATVVGGLGVLVLLLELIFRYVHR